MTGRFHLASAICSIVLLSLFALPSRAQSFMTVKPGTDAWWLRAEFRALDREVRGIPVAAIHSSWCKATEFRRELFPPELLVENGYDLLREADLAFSLEGSFDGSGKRQLALVGVYETCRGEQGRFFLILDADTQKVRFLDTELTPDRFSALKRADRGRIMVAYCFECDVVAFVRWDRGKKRFVMR